MQITVMKQTSIKFNKNNINTFNSETIVELFPALNPLVLSNIEF